MRCCTYPNPCAFPSCIAESYCLLIMVHVQMSLFSTSAALSALLRRRDICACNVGIHTTPLAQYFSESRGPQCFPSVSWVSQQGKHVAGFDIAPGAAGVGIGPAAAVPAPSVEGFSSNGFSGAPPMMGSNPGLSLGELYPQEEVVSPVCNGSSHCMQPGVT